MKRSLRTVGIVLSMVLVVGGAGCGDESDGSGYTRAIYEISGWTVNDDGCDGQGQNLFGGSRMLYVKFTSNPQPRMVASLCADQADCAQQLRSLESHPFAWTLSPAGENSWRGKLLDYQELDSGSCVANQVELSATTSDGQIRFEIRHLVEAEFAKTSCEEAPGNDPEPEFCDSGFCSAFDARQAAEGQACGIYEVIEGSQVNQDVSAAPASNEAGATSDHPAEMMK